MMRSVLITGGAGFIGSHVAAGLVAAGYRVRVLDSLHPQVHPGSRRPGYLSDDVELLVHDIRDATAVARALSGVDMVIHLAARVGVGQSMYEVTEYSSANTFGTAVLLEAMTQSPVERLVIASSMSVYGEGCYVDHSGAPHVPVVRQRSHLMTGNWDPLDAEGTPLTPVPTPETTPPSATSIYALDKLYQEQMCLLFGQAYHVPTTALRLFNVYGPHQALSNPYTGVLAIFAARLLNSRAPMVFEDGNQRRDFVHVDDVARAFLLAVETPAAAGRVINVGSGHGVTIGDVARRLAEMLGQPEQAPEVTGKYRVGDTRHCFADISLAEELLGYRPTVTLDDGISALTGWLEGAVAQDHFDRMAADLATRGLTV